MKLAPPPCLAFAIHAALAGHFLIPAARADDDADKRPTAGADVVERITVTANKQKRAISEVATSIDVLSSEDLESQLAQDIEDLVRYLPGVSVNRDAGRFGLSDFTIRGLSGNRVLIEIDGVRVGDQFSFGSFSNAGRNLVDLDNIKSVELIRGSASSLYGSSAIAGVVSFISKDPHDYVSDSGDFFSRVKTDYDGATRSNGLSVTGAMQQGPFGAMAIVNAAEGHELSNGGDDDSHSGATRTASNPQDTESRSALVKFTWQLSDDYLMRMTIDQREQNALTESYWSRVVSQSTNAEVDDLEGDDTQTRTRMQVDIEFDAVLPFIDAGLLQFYRQENETRQETVEHRHSLSNGTPFRRFREFSFDQDNQGVELTLTSALGDRVQHTLTYGFDWSQTDTAEMRDGYQTNLNTNVTTNIVMPDVFPVRDFPLSTTTESAIYIQDEIVLGASGVRVIPALRYDRYQLDARSDAIFAEDNSDPDAVTDLQFSHVSPKLGIIVPLAEGHSVYAQYAEGFRAPPAHDVNIGFENVMFGYTSVPNPDLKPETSRNRELGWRFHDDYLSVDISYFDNDYRDFIDSRAVVCRPGPNSPCTLITYQAQNRHSVAVKGYEFRGDLDLEKWTGLTGVLIKAAYSHAEGEIESDNQPLNSVEPDQWLVGFSYEAEAWRVALMGLHIAEKNKSDTANLPDNNQQPYAGPAPYRPESANLIDIYFGYALSQSITFNAAIMNATDRNYISWASTQTLPEDYPLIERYTAPGRTISAAVKFEF